jgi:parallel beta-helix repeat protein
VNKIVSGIMMILLMIGSLGLVFNIHLVRAEPATIYIRADGSIDPSTANITTHDNITYTITDNNYLPIVVYRSNIIIKGGGYMLQASAPYNTLSLESVNNVTIKNTTITKGFHGIYLDSSSSNVLSGNNVTAVSQYGIYLGSSSSNVLSGNSITANGWKGIYLSSSCGNSISGNNITANPDDGIELYSSSGNVLSGNSVTANGCGIYLDSSNGNVLSGNSAAANSYYGIYLDSSYDNVLSGNSITANGYRGIFLGSSSGNVLSDNNITANGYGGTWFHYSSNNRVFHNNMQPILISYSTNTWDDGYPSGGNYWSNYTGTDLFSGQYQNESGCDGIGDTSYTIDANNKDNYPLMYPYIAGDCDHNGIVNILDASLIGWYWQETVPPAPKNADLNNDGIINIADATVVGINWLKHA